MINKWSIINLEKNILTNSCGDASTCFQVWFLYSDCNNSVLIRMMNKGRNIKLINSLPSKKMLVHASVWPGCMLFISIVSIVNIKGTRAERIMHMYNEAVLLFFIFSDCSDINRLILI